MKILKLSCALLMSVWISSAQASLMLNVDNGILEGATDVLIGSTLYDVEFLDGTCIALFDGCDASNDFLFNTNASANMASVALMDMVFLDGVDGMFDSNVGSIRGCGTNSIVCFVITPHSMSSTMVFFNDAQNWINESRDSVDGGDIFKTTDTGLSAIQTWAVWTLAADRGPNIDATVPEPSTVILLLLGLAGLSCSRYRKHS